ncbi:hypothetical protein AB0I28_07110 [Phytomonospora sp. NPDC050363]|uniref:hypothetical protein n=1 Tax=Phytomonospora sp. NPDC050363 TaxID=3155642 RepID=UPI0033DF3193
MRKGYVIAVTALGLAWLVAECALASRWLDSAVLFTTPHPDEARQNAADTLWLAAVTVTGPALIALVAKLGGLRTVMITAAITTGVLAVLLAVPVYQAWRR